MERNYYLAFSLMPGIGPKKFDVLLRNFGTAENAWHAPHWKLIKILGENLAGRLEKFRKEFDVELELKKLKSAGVEFVCLADKYYPKKLTQISNPPIILFVKGEMSLIKSLNHEKALAIVGTRRITTYGKNVTEMFAANLAESGLIIVSGLALGVDGLAHSACLKSGGKTIAVLGNGVDICYPRENKKIYDEILKSGGAIISEMHLGENPTAGTFPARNRIVAGISDGILVTEGAQDSGSLITANFGLEFGRKVFAVPGPVTSSLSAAPLKLIEKGAKLVVTPEDVIKELGISRFAKASRDKKNYVALSNEEWRVAELLENESLHFDELVRRLKLDPAKVGTIISMMEMKGIIKNNGGEFSLY